MKTSFTDIATAYSYKSTWELKKANFIFSVVNNPALYSMATGAVKLGLKMRLPVEELIRNTIFEHFCGGQSIPESDAIVGKLGAAGVETILDYSAEGEKNETGFDRTMQEILLSINNAADKKHFPFAVFKVTGVAAAHLLEKIQSGTSLCDEDQEAYRRVEKRIQRICKTAYDRNVSILIDAEETWIQDTIDHLAERMMSLFNRSKAVVFNTYQLYRTASLANLKNALDKAIKNDYALGVKLVRGAYMEKERERAKLFGYPSPIQPNVYATDDAFSEALHFCVGHIDRISLVCGSHNEDSTVYLTALMAKSGIANDDPRVWFSQLFGMSDHISFNLAKEGYNVAKYLPYGPVKSVMPYLLRRAEENTSVAGQSNRELTMIRRELKRRKELHI